MIPGRLLDNLLLFGRVLHGLGLDGSPGRMLDVAAALPHIEIGRKPDFYHALRTLLVRRRSDLAAFDAAFEAFWRRPAEGSTTLDLRSLGERRRLKRPRFAAEPPPVAGELPGPAPPAEGPPRVRATLTWSADEVLRHKDFAQMTAEELAQVEDLVASLSLRVAPRRSRRLRPGPGPALDLRRSLRGSLRHGGEILAWARRERKPKPRPLVVLADVSGSMERYTRLLLLFAYGLSEALPQPLEAFAFGTRLTRITRELHGPDPERALAAVARAVHDWSGGTRIGESLEAFNFLWGRRVLGRGAVVLLISDGWDRGDPGLLRREMARLQRSCYRLVWLNPLLGSPDYEPLARGMRAALPHVDDFLPVHDLASLDELARRLEELDARRPGRRQPAAAVLG